MRSQAEIRKFAENKYRDFLRSLISDAIFFPLEVPFGRLSTTTDLPVLIDSIKELIENDSTHSGNGYTVVMADMPTRRHGQQRLPSRVFFASSDDFVGYLKKSPEVASFRSNLQLTRQHCPQLLTWLPSNIARVLEAGKDWPKLLEVCQWFMKHPRPQCYIREIPVAVHTKFIEEKSALLRPMLEHLLPDDFDALASDFPTRFYLKDKEPFVRLRIADPAMGEKAGIPLSDFAVPVSAFQTLPLEHVRAVIVIENEINFLSLPPIPGAVYIWGEGNGVHRIGDALWLRGGDRTLYWGDVDSRGITILSWLRRKLPKVRSVMMDLETLESFPDAEVSDPASSTPDIDRHLLTASELTCYDAVTQRHPRRRLEQERIPIEYALKKIQTHAE